MHQEERNVHLLGELRVQLTYYMYLQYSALKNDTHFTLASFGYKHKEVKQKGEVIDEWYHVTLVKTFNDEKEPAEVVNVIYEVE